MINIPSRMLLMGCCLCLAAATARPDGLQGAIQRDYPYLEDLFRHFHANPELSMQEHASSDRLARELSAAGFDLTRNIGNTGLAATLNNGPGPTVMIRADMDGLPVLEKTGLAYASKVRQTNLRGVDMPVMHACGHDMHMTTLVGVGRRMAASRARWSGTLILIGQPAEEAIGGARAMVEDRLYERVGRPDYLLALHVIARWPAGKIVIPEGLVYSSADTVNIRVHGIATHGATPQRGKDPVVVGSQIVLALQNIVTREVGPLEPALITVGAFNAGTAPNVIADHADLQITVRANTEKTRYQLLDAIERVAVNTARAAGLPDGMLPEVKVLEDGAPTTTNDRTLAARVRSAVSAGMGRDALVDWHQVDMGAEDFPWLVNVDPPIPSVYFEVGGTPPEKIANDSWAPHHSPLFEIDAESSIRAGVEAMTLAALELLAGR